MVKFVCACAAHAHSLHADEDGWHLQRQAHHTPSKMLYHLNGAPVHDLVTQVVAELPKANPEVRRRAEARLRSVCQAVLTDLRNPHIQGISCAGGPGFGPEIDSVSAPRMRSWYEDARERRAEKARTQSQQAGAPSDSAATIATAKAAQAQAVDVHASVHASGATAPPAPQFTGAREPKPKGLSERFDAAATRACKRGRAAMSTGSVHSGGKKRKAVAAPAPDSDSQAPASPPRDSRTSTAAAVEGSDSVARVSNFRNFLGL